MILIKYCYNITLPGYPQSWSDIALSIWKHRRFI